MRIPSVNFARTFSTTTEKVSFILFGLKICIILLVLLFFKKRVFKVVEVGARDGLQNEKVFYSIFKVFVCTLLHKCLLL